MIFHRGQKWFWMIMDWLAFVHDSVSSPDNHCLTIFSQKKQFDSQKTVKNAIVTGFYGILRTFTAIKWDLNPTQRLKLCCMCVSESNTHFLADYELNAYHWVKPIGSQKRHIDKILRQKMIFNDDGLTCICAWWCLSTGLSVFDHFLTEAAVW